jgi:hypothetical protein
MRPTTELDVSSGEEHDLTAKLTHTDLKAHTSACGGLRENERPLLACKHLWRGLAVLLQRSGQGQDVLDLVGGEFFDGKEVLHERQWANFNVRR